jgi:hypothetical protein
MEFCEKSMINVFMMSVVLLMLATTLARYAFIFVLSNPAAMDAGFW